MFGPSRPFSYSSRGVGQEDFLQKRAYQPDDFSRGLPQRGSMYRPNGKSIYMQRKEYSDRLNNQLDDLHVRVEHLFTFDLDGQELKTVDDCVAKIKRMDAKGHLWPQEMIMETSRGYLVLSDIETKAELEALPLRSIIQSRAVLDSCAYNSLLTLTVDDHNKRNHQLYTFQCEQTGAELIKADLDKVVNSSNRVMEPRKDPSYIRVDRENITGQPFQREMTPPPQDYLPLRQWRDSEYAVIPPIPSPDPQEFRNSPEISLTPVQMLAERSLEIFNHILDDYEIFMDKLPAAPPPPVPKQKKVKNPFVKKRPIQQYAEPAANLPPAEEYIAFLRKIKYAFNLLDELNDSLSNPTATDFIHIIFSGLASTVPRYPLHLPNTVVSPLLTEGALRLLSQVVNPAEDQILKSLGDSWNIPRSRWPGDVPPYSLEFYDGWQPTSPSPSPYSSIPGSRASSQRHQPGQRPLREPVNNSTWTPTPLITPSEPPLYMRVIYDFVARNNQELSVMKGDVVQVIQKSKQWWLVRNNRNGEGNIPQNVLEPMRGPGAMESQPRDTRGQINLDLNSTPTEVKAWLEQKGFSRITVNTLGVLTGRLLLGMKNEEIRTVCPEEGNKVFFNLQSVKASIALASETPGMYRGRQ